MIHFVNALIPILVLIALGYLLNKAKFLSAQTWAGIEKLTYFVMFPALLINTLASQQIDGAPWPTMLLIIFLVLTITSATLIALHLLPNNDSPAEFTSIFQGGVRFNTYIALSISGAYFGAEGLALASIGAGFMIPMINFLCVGVFVFYGKKEARSAKVFIKQLVMNPLIIGCAIGALLSITGIGLPGVTLQITEIIGRAALPLGLLAVGAALRPELVKGHFSAIVKSSVVQFLFKPVLILVLCFAFGLEGVAAGVLLIAFISPTASSAYILARQLGGDLESMASIITLQTLIAFLVMPLWAWYWFM
ncbi:AEC family transporter [Reinekea marina]|uniref:AEC family transporter n=1 Tax=Reinekea marina TaxID=1310421 RepID=A0ABV7WNN6_9GAMM|nr:AEC family transporter [Reinekea marina]MDN3650719.1 AEC family transporter [Reinekea marina]